MKNKTTYRPLFFTRNKKILIICSFLLMLMAKPIANIPLIFEDVKYELVAVSEKEDSSKKETASENEKEIKISNPINNFSFHIELKKQATYFVIQPSFLNFKQDIPLPPPRV